VRALNPVKDCFYPGGTIVCRSPYSAVVSYAMEGCQESIDFDTFQRQAGTQKICAIDLRYPLPIDPHGEESNASGRLRVIASDRSAMETIEAIYLAYQGTAAGAPRLEHVFTRRLQRIIDADRAAFDAGAPSSIDYSFFFLGNDFGISDIDVEDVSHGNAAEVRATFKNMGEPQAAWFRLRREKGRWVIDDVSMKIDGRRLSLVPERPGSAAPFWKARGGADRSGR
jgi:hypothetical protein